MLSKKRLRSVAHSIAQHGMSGLSFLHPHLGETCNAIGLDRAEVDLLNWAANSPLEHASRRISSAAEALRGKFETILYLENMSPDELSKATAVFFFARNNWPSACYVRITLTSGFTIERAVGGFGERAGIIHR